MEDYLEAINRGQRVQALGTMINSQKRDLDNNLDKALLKTVTNVNMPADVRVSSPSRRGSRGRGIPSFGEPQNFIKWGKNGARVRVNTLRFST